jgi:acetoin utilization deacetylase AcuC-like enzyme
MPLHLVHHPDYDARFPAHHRFPMGKYSKLVEELERKGILNRAASHLAEPASFEWLARAHDPRYIEQITLATVPREIEREIGFPVSEAVSRRSRLACGGTVMAARLALEHGIACNMAGGSHHARHRGGAGFCTLNDVGVAALELISAGDTSRILVVDLDVHQGDGTAEIFFDDHRVFTFSMHGEKNYPVRKAVSDLDVGLPDGLDDDAYMARLGDILPSVFDRARPDLVFFNAGVDPHRDDRLGRLSLTDAGLERRERRVIEFFRERNVPVCGVLGGGYSTDVTLLAARHSILFEVAEEFA